MLQRFYIQDKTNNPFLNLEDIRIFPNYLPTFSITSKAQEFINSYKMKRELFVQKYGKDPCPWHLKVFLDIHGIDFSVSKATLTKIHGRKLLKHIYLGDISSFQFRMLK
jgi:hypothetical protein